MRSVIVLGAGPAGLAAALELANSGVNVTVVEKQNYVGGNASSFDIGGINVDFGSHRLHPASDDAVLSQIKSLLGDDLLVRPRHGRIRLMGRWIHFPLRPVDLMLRSHPRFVIGVIGDILRKALPTSQPASEHDTFASVLTRGLGSTICKEFYFPYAIKIWGTEPKKLSAIQAYKRISAGSIGKMIKRLLPGAKGSGGANTKGIFYYPRRGFGQICAAYHTAALEAGVNVMLETEITAISPASNASSVTVKSADGTTTLTADQIYSTIPVTSLIRLTQPEAPATILTAATSLSFRAMILVYIQLNQDRFTEFDAHYFPGADMPFTRLSEPRNYTDLATPTGTTVLCAEIPCFRDDDIWAMTNEDLLTRVSTGLALAELPILGDVESVEVRRIPFAYPLYLDNYEKQFEPVDEWLFELDGLISFGRQGLYAHDNTHHAILEAQAAASCLTSTGTIDKDAWARYRAEFEKHVVEINQQQTERQRILVIGATGFIGSRVVEKLYLQHDAIVTAAIRRSKASPITAPEGVTFASLSLNNHKQVHELVSRHDIVINLAYDFTASIRNNVDNFAHLVNACVDNGIQRLVHVSSIVVYDNWPDGHLDETTAQSPGGSQYRQAKQAMETLLRNQADSGGLRSVIVQPTIVYGPKSKLWTDLIIERLSTGTLVLPDASFGNCHAVYVDDVADAIILATHRTDALAESFIISGPDVPTWREFLEGYDNALDTKSIAYQPIPILPEDQNATSSSLKSLLSNPLNAANLPPVRAVLNMIQRLLGDAALERIKALVLNLQQRRGPIHYLPSQDEVRLYAAKSTCQIDKAREHLGYTPVFTHEMGLQKCIRYHQDRKA